jgi:hypothetical protein
VQVVFVKAVPKTPDRVEGAIAAFRSTTDFPWSRLESWSSTNLISALPSAHVLPT